MFFYISKILSCLLSPLVWSIVLLGYSFKTKLETRAKKLRIAAIVLLYICSNAFFVDELYRLWEPVTIDHDLLNTHYDGAIILGGIGTIDERLSKINFSYGGDRLFQTLKLHAQGRVDKIIFTGGSGSIEFPTHREGIYVYKYLKALHVPDSDLVIESKSKNTYENAVFTKALLDSLQLKQHLLLITSASHMPRALAVFKKAGFKDVTPYITNRQSGARRFTPDHFLIPDAGALGRLEWLMHEWLGYLVYKLKGYA
jgi:uncharacterized SAM-binding protein YcdF (DUF218 family)